MKIKFDKRKENLFLYQFTLSCSIKSYLTFYIVFFKPFIYHFFSFFLKVINLAKLFQKYIIIKLKISDSIQKIKIYYYYYKLLFLLSLLFFYSYISHFYYNYCIFLINMYKISYFHYNYCHLIYNILLLPGCNFYSKIIVNFKNY